MNLQIQRTHHRLLPDARRVLMPSDSGQVAVEVVSLDLGPHLVAAAATTSLTSATAQT